MSAGALLVVVIVAWLVLGCTILAVLWRLCLRAIEDDADDTIVMGDEAAWPTGHPEARGR